MINPFQEPQDYGLMDDAVSASLETIEAGHPEGAADAEPDVQSDPALGVHPDADWADEGGAVDPG